MDIQITITHTIAPELIRLLEELVGYESIKRANAEIEKSSVKIEELKTEQVVEKTDKTAKTLKKVEKVVDPEPEKADLDEQPEPKKEMPKIDIADVRKKATAIIKSGKEQREQVKNLLEKYGVENVSSLVPNQYAAFNADLDKIKL